MARRLTKSNAHFRRAVKRLPLGVASNFRYWGEDRTIYVKYGRGGRIVDLDDNSYVDYRLGYGPAILGYADLVGARAVNDPTATNVVQIVLSGSSRDSVHGSLYMPDFGSAYSDTEVAAVANYVTARFGSASSNLTAANVADLRKEASK